MTPPGQPYSYTTSNPSSSADIRVKVNGSEVFPDITKTGQKFTINVAAFDVQCAGPGQNGIIEIEVRSGGTWTIEHTEEIAPCN